MFLLSWDNWLHISSKGIKAGQELKNIYEIKSLNMEYLFSIIYHIGIKWLAHLMFYRRESTGRKQFHQHCFCEERDVWFMIILELV